MERVKVRETETVRNKGKSKVGEGSRRDSEKKNLTSRETVSD